MFWQVPLLLVQLFGQGCRQGCERLVWYIVQSQPCCLEPAEPGPVEGLPVGVLRLTAGLLAEVHEFAGYLHGPAGVESLRERFGHALDPDSVLVFEEDRVGVRFRRRLQFQGDLVVL